MEAELPEGWTLEPFGLFANNVKERWEPGDETMEYIGLEHIASAQGSLVGSQSSAAVTSAKTRFKRGDTLFGKLRPNLRKYYRADFDGICSTDILALRPKSGMDGAFIYYVVHSADFIRYAVNDASGTKMPRTSWKRLAELHCLKPPLPEQQRIAEILTAVDDSIRAGERVIEQAERVKKGLMEELLTGGLGSAAIERGEVPERWELATLSDLFEIARGGSPRPIEQYITEADDGVNWIKIGDTSSQSKYITSTNEKIKSEGVKRSRTVEPGDFLLSNSMSFGRPYITQIHGCIHDGWLVLKPKRSCLKIVFMYYLLSSPATFKQFAQKAAGSAVKNLNKDLVGSVYAVLPIESEQERIASILTSIDDQIAAERKHVEQQKRLKQGLMDDLLTGRVRTV